MENKKNKTAKLLLVDSAANIKSTELKEKIDAAEVVFVGLKLVKNSGNTLYDRVGTLIARSEIAKIQRKYHRDEVEVVAL